MSSRLRKRPSPDGLVPRKIPNRIRTSARCSSVARPRLPPRGFGGSPPASDPSARMTPPPPAYREFAKRRDGMIYAMDGGLWLHRHVWKGRPLAHLVSTNRERLLAYGRRVGIPDDRLQFKPLKDPRTGIRRDAWHWDLGGPVLPPPTKR